MVGVLRKPCLGCGTLHRNASRCDTCQQAYDKQVEARRGSATARGYGPEWRKLAAQTLARHRRQYGDWCPGWRLRSAHESKDLTVDHKVPKSRGGTDEPDNLQVLCRPCNSAKHNR